MSGSAFVSILEAAGQGIFLLGCVITAWGVLQMLALLEKPSGFRCHARGASLISIFVLALVGFCEALFNGFRPSLTISAYVFSTGVLYLLFAKQLRLSAVRRMARRMTRRVERRNQHV